MTKWETIQSLRALRDKMQRDDIYLDDSAALTAAIEAINTPGDEKLYTAFDVIRIVQAAVSDAVCGMGAEESTVTAYEIEREIVAKLVGGESSEREICELATGRRRNVELQITTASNNSSDVSQTAMD